MSKRHLSVAQQTRALLRKSFLKKWRMKREALLEWFFSLLLVLFAYLFSSSLHQVNDFHQLPAVDLGRVDDFNDSNYVIALAPKSKTTQEIMNKVASTPFMKGRTIMGWPDEKSMDELDLNYSTDAVRVIFNDTFLYHLKFLWGDRIPKMKEHRDHSAHCQVMDETITCESSVFWEKGFVAFQAAINAAIVEALLGFDVLWLHLHYGHFDGSDCKIRPSCHPNWLHGGLHPLPPLWHVFAEYGRRHSPWFFLKSSFWFQHQRADHAALENETDLDSSTSDPFEPVSPEFHGKEAVRIRNLRKEYGRGKHAKVEALKGSVTIYNHSLSETADPGTISRLTGACPQPSVQFGFLTARENLRLFAQVKGIQPHEVAQEVQRVLRDLEMENIQDILAQHLSGGQKRKLTLGIAFLGDPQVLLLDEPTAGSDPLSRHHVWNLLKERKSDRVILFSTQFMDEADILADRKVFISSGRLKCAGSSLFLKKKWGIGYHLSLHLNEMCDPDGTTSLVKQHIPDAKLAAQSEEKLVYILPLERTSKFPDLYRDLDRRSNQGIENYGVSVTTLNEVFLKLEGKSGVDEPDIGIWGQLQSDRTNDTGSLVELEQVLSSLNETKSAVSGMALWRQQLWAMAKVRFLKLKKERRTLLTMVKHR